MISALLLAAARGSIVLLAAAMLSRALRAKPAALRHSIWTLAIASQLALPIVALLMPQRTVNFGRAGAFATRAAAAVVTTVTPPSVPATPHVSAQSAGAPRASNTAAQMATVPGAPAALPDMRTALQFLALVWAAGALLICLRFVIGTILVARDTRRAIRPVRREWVILAGQIQEDLHLHRPAMLLWGTQRAVPYTWGVISPVVCLPMDADTWSSDRLRIVLIHELAHVQRFDAMTEIMAQLALVVFWFNPLLWLAVRRMRTEREHACDDRVLMGGVKPSTYVEELLTMMKTIGQGPAAPAFGAIAMARRSQFESRMLAVLDERGIRKAIGRRSVAAVAVGMTALLLGIASVRPAAANPTIRFSGIRMEHVVTWAQSDFDEMVDDCQRMKPKPRVQYCEVRSIDLSSLTGAVSFRGGYIDGVLFTSKASAVTVTARALVRAEAITESGARALASKVTTSLADGVLHSEGPGGGRSNFWSVLYEVTLPAGRSVKARTELGQIGLRDFQGDADIAAVNGPLQVIGAAGDIKGRTENGPIYVGLAGTRWEGAGLDLQSQNGPIYLAIPERYSAHLITGTTNGPLNLTYPILVRHMNGKGIDADIGAGGPTIRVITKNGPADIR